MNLTSEHIYNTSQDLKLFFNDPITNYKYYKMAIRQIKLEDSLMKEIKYCSDNYDETNVIKSIPNIDSKKLKSEISNNFFNSKSVEAMSCILSGMSMFIDNDSSAEINRIKQYLTNLNKLNVNSADGYVFTADLGDAEKLFIVKTPQDPENISNMKHEAFVALYGLNKLRKQKNIFNFAYIYIYLECQGASFNDKGKAISWCSGTGKQTSFVIYENIASFDQNGENTTISFETFCKSCSPKDFLMYYLQIMLALCTAQSECGFSHNDLHCGNVMLRKVNKSNFYLEYPWDNKNIYILSKGYVATIIDFGRSHIQIALDGKTEHFGFRSLDDNIEVNAKVLEKLENNLYLMKTNNVEFVCERKDIIKNKKENNNENKKENNYKNEKRSNYENENIYEDDIYEGDNVKCIYNRIMVKLLSSGCYINECNTIIDAYKLLGFSLSIMKKYNLSCYDTISELLSFFNMTENPDDIIRDQSPNGKYKLYYDMMFSERNEDFKISKWINYIIKFSKNLGYEFVKYRPGDEILKCDDLVCKSFKEEMENVGIYKKEITIPETFKEFIDIESILNNNNTYRKVKDSFKKRLTEISKEEKKKIKILNEKVEIFTPLNISPTFDFITDPSIFSRMKDEYEKYINVFNGYYDLESAVNTWREVGEIYNDENILGKLPEYENMLTKKWQFREHLIKILDRNVNQIQGDNKLIREVENIDNGKYLWYWNTYNNLQEMI